MKNRRFCKELKSFLVLFMIFSAGGFFSCSLSASESDYDDGSENVTESDNSSSEISSESFALANVSVGGSRKISATGSGTLSTALTFTTSSDDETVEYTWEIVSGEEYAVLSDSNSSSVTITGNNGTAAAAKANTLLLDDDETVATSATETSSTAEAATDSQTVVVQVTAKCGDVTLSETMSVVIAGSDETVEDEISDINLSTRYKSIAFDGSTTLTALASYSGNAPDSYKWEITDGSDYAELDSSSSSTAVLTGINTDASSHTVTVKVTAGYSDGDENVKTSTVTVNVLGAPETFTWDFAANAASIYSDAALSSSVTKIQYKNGSVAGYLKGASSGSSAASMKIETPVSGSKIEIRNSKNDVQVNAGSLFYIPVSNGSVVTVVQKNSSGGYELGGEESLTYTASKAGYVIYEALTNHYLSKIEVTDVFANEKHTEDVVSFVSQTNSGTANTTDVLGFTAKSVSSSDTGVVKAEISSGAIKLTSKSAGTAKITASGSGSESVSWTVTVRRYGKIEADGITPYSDAEAVESVWLKTYDGNTVYVQDGRVTTEAGKFVYLNRKFASGSKVKIEATTVSYTAGGKTLDAGFIENPSNVSSASGIYTTATGANSGNKVGNSTNSWSSGNISKAWPYTYVCEYEVGGSSSSHYLYDSNSVSSDATSFYSKENVTSTDSFALSSCYAIFGDTENEVIFTSIKVYENDELVYSSKDNENGKIPSEISLTLLNGDSDLAVGYTMSGSSYIFTAKAPGSGTYSYKWYVDSVEKSGNGATLTTALSSGIRSIIVVATDSETGVSYTANYALEVQ